jgi:hypothetical protein
MGLASPGKRPRQHSSHLWGTGLGFRSKQRNCWGGGEECILKHPEQRVAWAVISSALVLQGVLEKSSSLEGSNLVPMGRLLLVRGAPLSF